jgi:hypothetical protein
MAQASIWQRLSVEISAIAALSGTTIDEGLPQPAPRPDEDPRLKKIYIYADNVWTPHSTTDCRIIRVRTDAFDLTGWIDFTHAQPQDQFQTEVRVTMAHATDVLVQRTAFSAGWLAMMHHMTGASSISGNHIDILIWQTHSQNNFATPTPVAYQFIVESR